MPFFNHLMARSIQGGGTTGGQPGAASQRRTRSMPGATASGKEMVFKDSDPTVVQKYRIQVTKRKLLFMRSLLRAQVDQVYQSLGAYPIEQVPKLFAAYKINFDNMLHEDDTQKIFEAKNFHQPEFFMMARVYESKQIDPHNSVYLKMLRHLGRKHPYIVHTWEIFCDTNRVYVIQEFVIKGNLVTYLEQNPDVDERLAAFWAKQVYRALDFLGDNGIAHRNVSPNHLVVQPAGKEIWLKLTGFRYSYIYWDIETNDVNYCPCRPVEKQKEDGPNFQPPEVYGDPNHEQFDPILADIWSYGANIYYMLAKQYPYNLNEPYDNIDEEIQHNVQKVPNLSNECKEFLVALLRTNANDRMPFDFVERDPWLRTHTTLSKGLHGQTPHKTLHKVKIIAKKSMTTTVSKQSMMKSSSMAVASKAGSMTTNVGSSSSSKMPSKSVSSASMMASGGSESHSMAGGSSTLTSKGEQGSSVNVKSHGEHSMTDSKMKHGGSVGAGLSKAGKTESHSIGSTASGASKSNGPHENLSKTGGVSAAHSGIDGTSHAEKSKTSGKSMSKEKSMSKSMSQATQEKNMFKQDSSSSLRDTAPSRLELKSKLNQLIREVDAASKSRLSIVRVERTKSSSDQSEVESKADQQEFDQMIENLKKKIDIVIDILQDLVCNNLHSCVKVELQNELIQLKQCAQQMSLDKFEEVGDKIIEIVRKIDSALDNVDQCQNGTLS